MTPEGIEFTKNEWIPALRSGEYKQGRSYLNQGDEFCCLGVACDLLKERLSLSVNRNKNDDITQFNEGQMSLPQDVQDFLGVDSGDVILPRTVYGRTYVTELNDLERLSFNQIADILEELFVKQL